MKPYLCYSSSRDYKEMKLHSPELSVPLFFSQHRKMMDVITGVVAGSIILSIYLLVIS